MAKSRRVLPEILGRYFCKVDLGDLEPRIRKDADQVLDFCDEELTLRFGIH